MVSRQVFDESVREEGDILADNAYTNVRYLSKEFAQFQETIITGTKIMIAVYSDNPYAFVIQDKLVAQSYKKYFELLWSVGKP